MKRLFHLGTALLVTLAGTAKAQAQARPLPSGEVQKIYDRLLKQIDRIPIYDHHSHATFPDDSDMDAMASPPEESTVMRLGGRSHGDRKSTRLNSSHLVISYAVFCLKQKRTPTTDSRTSCACYIAD